MKITGVIILVIIAGIVGCTQAFAQPKGNKPAPTHNQIAGPAYLKRNANELKGTIITPHLEQRITPGKNVLWCSTFQLAWNELYKLSGGPIRLKPASSMAEILNKRGASKVDIDDASYVAMAGFAEDGLVKKIRQELKRKFRGQESPDLLNKYAPTSGFMAYGYLFKMLPFEWAFDRLRHGLTFADTKVESFGIEQYAPERELREAKSGKQISILDYRSQDDFIIELKTRQKKDHLILAKVTPKQTLEQTVHMVTDRMAHGKRSKFAESATLSVPVLDFDLLKSYPEIQEHTILSSNKRLNGQPIDGALQSIRLRLDETGAVVKSEAIMWKLAVSNNLIFNKPFLVLLKREGAKNPYFALWVGNSELLLPAGTGK